MTTPALLVKKRLGFLSAGDPHAKAVIDKMGIGEVALVTIRRVRNPKFHRLFFALIQFAYDSWEPPGQYACFKNIDQFRRELTIAAGYYETMVGVDGELILRAKSISWGSMDETEFSQLFESVVRVLSEGFIPGMTPEQAERFTNELEGFV